MAFVNEILKFLEEIAPPVLAEDWDNVGLLCGSGDQRVNRALVALDITSAVAEEARAKGAQLVVSHHPVIFRPLRAIAGGSAAWRLANASVSAICMHTNLDIAPGGVNDALAERLGLQKPAILSVTRREAYNKVVVFVPAEYAQKVRDAMAAAGAGKFGNYDSCAYEGSGNGYFRPLEGSRPFLGSRDWLEKTEEIRVEAVCRSTELQKVVDAVRAAHPYEVPAYDVFSDESLCETWGLGRIGTLGAKTPLAVFAAGVQKNLLSPYANLCDAGRPVLRVAVCSGAGDVETVEAASKAGADTFVTGELKHSLKIEALERGLNVVEAGHFATENVICPVLCRELSTRFGDVRFEIADSNRDPSSEKPEAGN